MSIFKSQECLSQLAYDCYQKQEYTKALKYAKKSLKKDPQQVATILLLGNIYYVQQNYSKAQNLYQQVLDIDSQNISAQINLADIYIIQKKYIKAETIIKKIEPIRYADFLWGKLYFDQENYALSEEYLYRYSMVEKENFWSWNLLSQSAQKNNKFALALDAGLMAVDTSKGDTAQHLNLAYAIYEIALEKGREFVLPTLKKWHQKYADDPVVMQSWHSFFPDQKFVRSTPQYIKNVFDNFSDSFEETLADLDYKVPQYIVDISKKNLLHLTHKKISILDLGCGTGLCAKELLLFFKKASFYGVDLSPKMLDEAKKKDIYKQLICCDIESYLSKQKKEFNLIVAADVFTYFGDLSQLFNSAYNNLKKDGYFIFSVSENSSSDSIWQQHISGRFLHGKKYIENMLQKSGFYNVKFNYCCLRKEAEKQVLGWVVIATK